MVNSVEFGVLGAGDGVRRGEEGVGGADLAGHSVPEAQAVRRSKLPDSASLFLSAGIAMREGTHASERRAFSQDADGD